MYDALENPNESSKGQPCPYLAANGLVSFSLSSGSIKVQMNSVNLLDMASFWQVYNLVANVLNRYSG